MRALVRAQGAAAVLLLATAAAAQAQERYALGGDHVAIYNLVGDLEVVGISGGQVTVDVTRGGPDGGELRVEVGRLADRQTLRVVYPSDRIIYRAGSGPWQRWRGSTQLRVRADGTWGGDGERGRAVRITGGGSGTQAHADLRVGVPRGQRVDLFLGVGRVVADNVDGHVRLQTASGAVQARRVSGGLTVRTGSGAVRVDDVAGTLVVSTGSGGVRAADVRGDSISVRTGSGRVALDGVDAHLVRLRTGSGGVQLSRAAAGEVHLNTGSGSVSAELLRPVDELRVRTGSGGVTLRLAAGLDASVDIRTGSGRIETDFPVQVTAHHRRALRGVIGQGRGTIQVNTGSGSVRLRGL
jgi:hypothetical protein